jgi:vacuolar protein sorting-associated protein 13A/C
MFESVVRTVLNKFLGDYVSNLETNQLNVGIFSGISFLKHLQSQFLGNVVLNGLKLKREALDKLNLPIAVYQGYLGRLELQIPWTNLKQQPVVVTISDMYILAGPRVQADVNPAEQSEKEYKSKMERIITAELFDLESAVHAEAAERGKLSHHLKSVIIL